jgi:hypothetical protein
MIRGTLAAAGAALALSVGPAGAEPIRVVVNGAPVHFANAQPTQVAGRVMIPLRGVLEQVGARRIEWRPGRQEVLVAAPTGRMRLQIGSRTALVDGQPVMLDVPPMILQNTTMVPLRFVSENMGARVDWLAGEQTVYIATGTERVAGSRQRLPADDRDPGFQSRDRNDGFRERPRRREVITRDPITRDPIVREPQPRSSYVTALYPRPGATVNDPRTEVFARFRAQAPIEFNSVRIRVNGEDVTRDAQITADGIRYLPLDDLRQGRNEVRLTFRDTRGVETSQEWYFIAP